MTIAESFRISFRRIAREPGRIMLLLSLVGLLIPGLYASDPLQLPGSARENNLQDLGILLNGRIWFNKYTRSFNTPYFLSEEFLPGSVVFNGQKFDNLSLRYDMAEDELIIAVEGHPAFYLNKEMVDSFRLAFRGKEFLFFNAGNDRTSSVNGYVNIIYKGSSSLFEKHGVRIRPLAIDGRLDLFQDQRKIWLIRNKDIVEIDRTNDFFHCFGKKKSVLKTIMKQEGIRCSIKEPESFVPLLRHIDSGTLSDFQ